jgi:hypothetical protein
MDKYPQRYMILLIDFDGYYEEDSLKPSIWCQND